MSSAKCLVMQERLERIKRHVQTGEDYFEEGRNHDAYEEYKMALASDPSRASRFTAEILQVWSCQGLK